MLRRRLISALSLQRGGGGGAGAGSVQASEACFSAVSRVHPKTVARKCFSHETL